MRTASSPATRSPPVTVPNRVAETAADLVADAEGEDDVADVAGGLEDVAEDDDPDEDAAKPSACESTLSAWYEAETPDELLHVAEFGVPTPETKFTAMHW